MGAGVRLRGHSHLLDSFPVVANVTRREHEIMRLVSDGLSVREIAAHLHISHHTVKHHMKNASAKLKAQNGKHAVALYVRAHG